MLLPLRFSRALRQGSRGVLVRRQNRGQTGPHPAALPGALAKLRLPLVSVGPYFGGFPPSDAPKRASSAQRKDAEFGKLQPDPAAAPEDGDSGIGTAVRVPRNRGQPVLLSQGCRG